MPQTDKSVTWMQSWGKKTTLLWFRLIILIMMKTNYGRCVFSRCSNTILRREIVKLFVITLCYLIFKIIFSGTKQLPLTVLPTECLNWNIVMWKRNELQSLTTITKATKPFLVPKLNSQHKPNSLSHSTFTPFLLSHSHSHSPISNSFQLSARRTSPLDAELLQEPPHCSRNTCCTHIFHAPSLP